MIDTQIVYLSWSPTPQRMKAMKKSFESVKKCTNRPHILTVVDNGPEEQREWFKTQEIDIHLVNKINVLVGPARNQGAIEADTKYVVFIDNDVVVFPDWLNLMIGALEKYPDRKLVATGVKSKPMKLAKYYKGMIGTYPEEGYQLYSRAAGMCVLMKRIDFEYLGRWNYRTSPGGIMCNQMKHKKYLFIWHPTWKGKHIDKGTYHYKKQRFIPETGEWVAK